MVRTHRWFVLAMVFSGCSSESFEVSAEDAAPAETLAPPDTHVEDTHIEDTHVEDTEDTSAAHADANADADAVAEAAVDALPCDAPVRCWVDKDGDGYTLAGVPVFACSCPTGTASRDPAVVVDCNDENPAVHPGALTYHDAPYCVPGTSCATMSFDYDCSGAEEKRYPATFTSCGTKASGCAGTGWTVAVPECGANGTFVTCSANLLSCDANNAPMTQPCR